jgi:hypothetical protein
MRPKSLPEVRAHHQVGAPLLASALQGLLDLWDQNREIRGDDFPEDVEVDEVVTVDQPIAGAHDLAPRDRWLAILKPFRHPACSFSDDLDEPRQRKLKKSIAATSGSCCDINVAGVEQDAVAEVAAERRARIQIDAPAQEGRQLFLQTEEGEARRAAILELDQHVHIAFRSEVVPEDRAE